VAAELKLAVHFDRAMLDAFAGYSPFQTDFELRKVPIHQLTPSMVPEKDVRHENLVILKSRNHVDGDLDRAPCEFRNARGASKKWWMFAFRRAATSTNWKGSRSESQND